jgi:outer membrane protein OmpA-like peptidoglycan-associated protein
LAATPVFAKSASKEEKVGVGLGAVVGAVAGGPVGVIIGAALGAKVGDGYYQRDEKVDGLTASLHGSESRAARLEADIHALNGQIAGLDVEVERLRESSRPELVSLMQAGIAVDLLFRTDEDVLSDSTGDKLQQLAATLATMHNVQIQLDGFADERGDASYNQQLSVRRAEHVRDVLLANGIPATRIQLNAHGENPATDTNIDSYALDRKVSLTLYIADSTSLASNPM